VNVGARPRGNEAWITVRVEGSQNREGLIGALFVAGSTGVHEDGHAIVTHFPPGTSVSGLKDAIAVADPGAEASFGEAPAADWSRWRAAVGSHQLGALTISPPWLAPATPAAMTVIIEPAMAFGTGEHPTTRGVIRLMQGIPDFAGLVVDLGAGSAVLSIAAAKLGAVRVAAVEIDPDAIGNAEANIAANDVGRIVHIIHGDAELILPLLAPVGLVLANIISSVLLGLLPAIGSSVRRGGHVILSGILTDERSAMLQAVDTADWTLRREDVEEAWWSVLFERR